jgi:hypothetical protein
MKDHINSSFFSNFVSHQRIIPLKNAFKYNVTSMLIEYKEINYLNKNIKFFSYNKFNIFSFYEVDHGYRDGRTLKEFVKDILKKNIIKYNNLSFKILCFPRIFGYVFNPLSIIFCYDSNNLIAILYEVKNTSNEQHTYCFASNNHALKSEYKHSCKKIFYVSPFIEMNTYYKFITKIPCEKLFILIEQFNQKNQKILVASQIGKKINFSSATIIKSFIKNPLMTIKVIMAIHYQAFKIMIKGGKYYSREKKPVDTVSFEGKL